jgi:hypothetical protein
MTPRMRAASSVSSEAAADIEAGKPIRKAGRNR